MTVVRSAQPVSPFSIANRVMVRVRATDVMQANRYTSVRLENARRITERREVMSSRGPSYSTVDFGILSKNLDFPVSPVSLSDMRDGVKCQDIEKRGTNLSEQREVSLHEVLVASGILMEAVGRDGARTYSKYDGSLVESKEIYTAITPLGFASLFTEKDPDGGELSESDFNEMMGAFGRDDLVRFIQKGLKYPAVRYLLDRDYGEMFLRGVRKDVFGVLRPPAQSVLIKISHILGLDLTKKYVGSITAEDAGQILEGFNKDNVGVIRDVFKDGITFYRALPLHIRRELAENGDGADVFGTMSDEEAITHLSMMLEADRYYGNTFMKCDEAFFYGLGRRQQLRFISLLPDWSRAEYFETLLGKDSTL